MKGRKEKNKMINEKDLTEVNCKYIITVDKRFSLIDTRRLRFGEIGVEYTRIDYFKDLRNHLIKKEVKEFDGAFYKTFYDCGLIFHKTDDIEDAAKVFAGVQND